MSSRIRLATSPSQLPVVGCLRWLRFDSNPRGFTGVCGLGGSGIWRMAHVGPEWSHGMAYDGTRHTDVDKRGGSWIGVDPTRTSVF
jgi:hypothetical protein